MLSHVVIISLFVLQASRAAFIPCKTSCKDRYVADCHLHCHSLYDYCVKSAQLLLLHLYKCSDCRDMCDTCCYREVVNQGEAEQQAKTGIEPKEKSMSALNDDLVDELERDFFALPEE